MFYFESDKVQNEGQHNERTGEPGRRLCQLFVPSLGLALGKEGLCAAGDGAGQPRALTALHQYDSGDGKTGKQLKNGENNVNSTHVF